MLPALRAAVDRIIPGDRWPSGWDGGVGDYLTDDGPAFRALPERRQDELLAAESGSAGFEALRRVCWEGYYAAADGRMPVGLEMVGYRPVPPGVRPIDPVMPATVTPHEVAARYDAVIVGSGPGGGVAAQVLTGAGRRVLLVERAPMLSNSALRGDHLHGKRNAVYWPSAGPGPGHPRLIRGAEHDEVVDGTGDAGLYGLNADALGGGTRVWQGMSWRFLPEDFSMATQYGNPDGASLADWPVGYDEMEPYYTRAEWELGVAGEEGALTRRTPRSAGYPMPARELLSRAAETLGWGWGPIPLAINSVPRDGRPACVRCPQCVGHACPVDAKNGAHNTFIARAVASGGCDLLVDAEVIEVRDGAAGAGVTIMADVSGTPVTLTVGAEAVIDRRYLQHDR